MDKEKSRKKKRAGLYIAGSAVIAIGAFIAMPKVIDFLSSHLEITKSAPSQMNTEDDWGPKIVKK